MSPLTFQIHLKKRIHCTAQEGRCLGNVTKSSRVFRFITCVFVYFFNPQKTQKEAAVKTQGTVFIFQVCAMAIAFNRTPAFNCFPENGER